MVIGNGVLMESAPMFAETLPAFCSVTGTVPVLLTVRTTGAWLVALSGMGLVAARVIEAVSGHGIEDVAVALLVTALPHTVAPA
ncbi:Uncharacterised protein [uncultured archaeon]|nr:Uncharacterised protein [uncultured archaeon]